MEASMLVWVIVVTALVFEFVNGWNDAANSIATIVSTRVLTPVTAVGWAAFWNFVAAFVFGTAVAKTMGKGLVHLEMISEVVLLAGLVGAVVWTATCTWMGLPISVSHALMGGYGGAAVLAAGPRALIVSGWIKPLVFIGLAPLIGLVVGILVSAVATWFVRGQAPRRVDTWFRRLQLVSAAAFSLGHGTNDAQKGMGIITAALFTGQYITTYEVPLWVKLACYGSIALGTLSGGWRVIRTMGQRITKLTPFGGFAAESSAAVTLFGTALAGIPASTTHTVAGSIIGIGASRRVRAVRWGVTRRIVAAWILTIPGAAVLGSLSLLLLRTWF